MTKHKPINVYYDDELLKAMNKKYKYDDVN
jgi:hypothetical protein